ncbi:OLC1v1004097C1 [Oldenlandia corymbosa var. corymbosa]|uniref:OLC1v1004097C1 n=1 Tax=Oldenlandia corymbosa var. corymbosa TaxID=529605 RepID=A0AAV1DBG3_OLDCO|nr:OLC1v1004097C1 [Oldenlandia corymbosa var. corymbosa]
MTLILGLKKKQSNRQMINSQLSVLPAMVVVLVFIMSQATNTGAQDNWEDPLTSCCGTCTGDWFANEMSARIACLNQTDPGACSTALAPDPKYATDRDSCYDTCVAGINGDPTKCFRMQPQDCCNICYAVSPQAGDCSSSGDPNSDCRMKSICYGACAAGCVDPPTASSSG